MENSCFNCNCNTFPGILRFTLFFSDQINRLGEDKRLQIHKQILPTTNFLTVLYIIIIYHIVYHSTWRKAKKKKRQNLFSNNFINKNVLTLTQTLSSSLVWLWDWRTLPSSSSQFCLLWQDSSELQSSSLVAEIT